MRILITNDDGIDAEGLHLLEELARTLSDDITVVAPATNQSGTGRSISLDKDIGWQKRDERHYVVEGTPSDCVMLALHVLFCDKKPDLLLSGINHGMNVADDIGYSGTIGGAMEGAIVHIPAIALSQCFGGRLPDFTPARTTGKQILEMAMAIDIPARTVININFPAAYLGHVKGIRPAILDNHKVSDMILPGDHLHSYRIGPLVMDEQITPKSDRWWIKEGYISVTPLMMDNTALSRMDVIPSLDF